MPLGREEERLQNLYRIIEATHTLRADIQESLDDLSAFDARLGSDSTQTAPREEAHRSLREASVALAELRQRVQDSLAELGAVGSSQDGDTGSHDSLNPDLLQQPTPSESTHDSTSRPGGQASSHPTPNLNLIHSLVPEVIRTSRSILQGATQASGTAPREENLRLALHFVTIASPALGHGAATAPTHVHGSEGHDMSRPALARLSAVMGRREMPPPGSDPAATSLGRRVAARAANTGNAGSTTNSGAGPSQTSRPPPAVDEGLLSDLHIFLIPNDPAPGFSPAAGRPATTSGPLIAPPQVIRNPERDHTSASDDLPDLVPLDEGVTGMNSVDGQQAGWGRPSDPPSAPRIPQARTSTLFSRQEGEETGSWPPRRRRGSSFEEAIETAEGRSYQIRRRLDANGEEYVHQIPRREWMSARTNPDTVQSRVARGFFPLTYAGLAETSGTPQPNVTRQPGFPGASAESSPFGTSMLDLPSSIESESRSPSLPISIRRRRSGKYA